MAASTTMTDYLGKGLLSARPASLTLAAGVMGLYYATDTKLMYVWDGSAWATSGASPYYASTPVLPLTTDVTLEKDGGTTASISQSTRGIIADVTGAAATDKNVLLSKGAVGSSFTLIAFMGTPTMWRRYMALGLYIKETSSGKIKACCFAGGTSGALSYRRMSWTDITTFSTSTDVVEHFPTGPVWMKMVVSGTTVTISISVDGETFEQIDTFTEAFLGAINTAGVFFGVNQTDGQQGVHAFAHVMGLTLA